MRATAHGWKKPGGGGPSVEVAKDFVAADKAKGTHMKKGGHMKSMKPRLPAALLAAAAQAPPPNMPAGPSTSGAPGGMPPGAPGAGPPGMKKGGVVPKTVKTPEVETKERKWPLKGEDKDGGGQKIAMKSGGKLASRGMGAATKGYASGGSVRGHGICERGKTRGRFV